MNESLSALGSSSHSGSQSQRNLQSGSLRSKPDLDNKNEGSR